MAPLPKKKRTQSHKRTRWSHFALQPVSLSTCPQCRSRKLAHRVCPTCGHYAGREVIAMGTREEGKGET